MSNRTPEAFALKMIEFIDKKEMLNQYEKLSLKRKKNI